jgi:hypothetical protein
MRRLLAEPRLADRAGHLARLSTRSLRRVVAALDASLNFGVRWRGASLDRLLDEDHATIVAAVAELLRRLSWLVAVEVTYSEFGERGSFDLIAFHPVAKVLLVAEVKTDLPSAEATLRKLDNKTRLAARVAHGRLGWEAAHVGRILVMPNVSMLCRRVGRNAALFDHAFPARNVAVRHWLTRPSSSFSGLWFVSSNTVGLLSRQCERDKVSDGRIALLTTLACVSEANRAPEPR